MASEFFFDIQQSRVREALLYDQIIDIKRVGFLRRTLWLAFRVLLGLFIVGFFAKTFSQETLSLLLAGIFLSFAGVGTLFLLESFGGYLKTRYSEQKTKNLADALSFKSSQALKNASSPAKVLLFLVRENPELRFVFNRLLLDWQSIEKQLKPASSAGAPTRRKAEDIPGLVEKAFNVAQGNGHKVVEKGDLLVALAEEEPVFKEALREQNISPKDVGKTMWWLNVLEEQIQEQAQWWQEKNLRKRGTLARAWTAGFTPTLDQFSFDLTESLKKQGAPRLIGHVKEVESLERALSRIKANNALLVGEPGSGRKSIVYEIALRSMLGESVPRINYRRVLELDVPGLLAHVQGSAEREQYLDQIFQEVVRAGNVILFIDDFHNYVSSKNQGRPGSLDISGSIAKYLATPYFPIIACTTFSGLHQDIEQNSSILGLLEKVEVSEISPDETLQVLFQLVFSLERRYRKFIPYQAVRDIVKLSAKYIQAVPFPQKAVDLLQEAMVLLSQTKNKVLLSSHIASLVSARTQIPVGDLESQEKEVLLNLEGLIHKRIVDQEEAVGEVSSALRRARTAIGSRKGPMGTFLFLGPTGVGKTETAKALSAIYFGSEERMVRLDMSEYQNIQDTERLLGSAAQEGTFCTQVRENPFSLILLDELEKAHPNILNLFLQVLDEGHITDGLGRKVSFQHTIIIATSNAGSQLILQALKDQKDFITLKEEIVDYLFKEGVYRPEFLNRFDAVVLFKPLAKEHLLQIVDLMLSKLKKNLAERGIEFSVTQPLKEKLAELGYDPKFGARNLKRIIQDNVENAFAVALLRDTIQRGDKVEMQEDFTITKL
ncbi:MAG: ATP-dependent Clp protease ATP-binding subunit [Candidatus Wildermuthbacteria bacterium]|nr:ATP-dependent Clp protease ATP-binding subunit [Candidatus Wildermuthbacteria bacterium]